MKRSEALVKINDYYQSLPESLSIENRLDKVLKFIEQEKIMIPSPEYQSHDVAYGCEWEDEEPESDVSAI